MRDIKKYPFVKQNDFKDCGICSLQMIIKYYKGYVGKETLREMTKTTKNGTTAYHLIECLKKIGFNAYGISCNIENIIKNKVTLPCIAHVTINNSYNHYVVIYSINIQKHEIIVADPALYIKKVSFKEFSKIFNNVLIICYPIKTVPIMYKESSFSHFVKNILLEHKKYYFSLFIFSLLITFISIIGTFYWRFLIDGLNKSNKYLFSIFIFFLLFKLIELTSNFIRNKIVIAINQKVSFSLTSDIFNKIISLPYHYYRNRTTGEIISRINDLNIVRDVINKFLLTIMIDLILTILSFYFLLRINNILFLISLIIMIIHIIIYFIFKNKTRNSINDVQISNGEINSYMVETITGFETLKGLSVEKIFSDNFKIKYKNYLDKLLTFDNLNNLKDFIGNIVSEFSNYSIIFIGIIFVKKNYITLGELFMFQVLFQYFLMPLKTILNMDSTIKEASNAYKRIAEILPIDSDNTLSNNVNLTNIQFNNVYYTPDDQNYVLKNVSFSVNKNEKAIIIGQSGVGKSTILKMLKGYYKCNKGSILINGQTIDKYSKQEIDENIIYISQNEFLFTDSIYNNITLNDNVSENDFDKICKSCFVDAIVKKNPLSYFMLLEENGFNISGGEKQRIILARSLLRKFNIILIDEGFSELDTNLERKILKNLFNTYKDKIFIVISHRLDNLDLYDKLIEIKDGRVDKIITKNDRRKLCDIS